MCLENTAKTGATDLCRKGCARTVSQYSDRDTYEGLLTPIMPSKLLQLPQSRGSQIGRKCNFTLESFANSQSCRDLHLGRSGDMSVFR